MEDSIEIGNEPTVAAEALEESGLVLSAAELRVLGCLIEKERTTPDYYPLTLKALATACNQKSNREPVMELSEAQTQDALASLGHHHLAREKGSMQTARYAHMMPRIFELDDQAIALIAVLFLRGPQTAGELRTRTNRMCEFESVDECELILDTLAERQDGPGGAGFVLKLPRQPGKREARYMHLFAGEVDVSALAETAAGPIVASDASRELEARVAVLEAEVAGLKQQLESVLNAGL